MPGTDGPSTRHLLMRAAKLHRQRVHDILNAFELYRGQSGILHVLWQEEGIAQSEIAQQTWVRPATMTNALQRMEQVGLVERRPDPQDQRRSLVYLTQAGRELEGPVRQALANVDGEILDGFSSDEEALLRSFLERIVQSLEKGD